jgi:type II secretory pathway pseudopilin PulG
MKFKSGLTIIEIIIVIGVLGLLLSVGGNSFTKFRNVKALQNTTDAIVSVLNDARGRTLAGEGDSQYGVHFSLNEMVLFTGTTFIDGSGTNVIFSFESPVVLGTVNLNGGGDDIVFDKQSGSTNDYGSIEVEIPDGTNKTIIVESTGVISVD